jgi:hypothetical protein
LACSGPGRFLRLKKLWVAEFVEKPAQQQEELERQPEQATLEAQAKAVDPLLHLK